MKQYRLGLLRLPGRFVALLAVALLPVAQRGWAQTADSTKQHLYFKGAVSVTNNGFSFIPSFSLGKPAAIVNLNLSGGKRFSFEPEFRYGLSGKPWSFIFIWRYKLVHTRRFQLTLGTHLPALNFRTVPVVKNGVQQDVIQSTRFFPVMELAPNLALAKDINVGLFYLYGQGVKEDQTPNTHFLSLRANFSNIRLSPKWYLRAQPQVFYLRSDTKDGFYAASSLSLGRRGFPLSVSTLVNKRIRTDIAGKDLDWNISLVYAFGKEYVRL